MRISTIPIAWVPPTALILSMRSAPTGVLPWKLLIGWTASDLHRRHPLCASPVWFVLSPELLAVLGHRCNTGESADREPAVRWTNAEEKHHRGKRKSAYGRGNRG